MDSTNTWSSTTVLTLIKIRNVSWAHWETNKQNGVEIFFHSEIACKFHN